MNAQRYESCLVERGDSQFDSRRTASDGSGSRARVLLLGGLLAVVGVGCIALMPEFGVASGVGGIVAGCGSALATIISRR